MQTVRKKAYVILDGTLLPIDRIAADRPYYSRKEKHHGMNVQVLADPAGRLIWVSDALPGATHDLTAARTHGIPVALAADGIKRWATHAYQGAGSAIRVPFRGKHLHGWRRRHNRAHVNIRSLGERAMAILKSWRLLRKLPLASVGKDIGAPTAFSGETGGRRVGFEARRWCGEMVPGRDAGPRARSRQGSAEPIAPGPKGPAFPVSSSRPS